MKVPMKIFLAKPTGGKAGKGRNKTSTFQVKWDHTIMKQFRFRVGDNVSRDAALHRAQEWMAEAEKWDL